MTPSPRAALLLAPFPAPSKLLVDAALPLFARRMSSSSPARSRDSDTSAWPLLKRRARPSHDTSAGAALGQGLLARLDTTSSPSSLAVEQGAASSAVAAKTDPRVMLTIHGLSTNLNASDFYRIAPSDLSSWHSVIKKVQQQRDPSTLEPLGRYHVSFSTPAAATAYRDRLVRLHRLARHRLRSESGLWEASTPAHLRSPGLEPAAELAAFTVAPPPPTSSSSSSRAGLDVEKRRVSAGAGAWARQLADLVRGAEHGYGDKPPVVLLRVYPPTLAAEDLRRSIREDGVARGCRWKVSAPQQLHQQRAQRGRDRDEGGDSTHRKVSSRAHDDRDTPETLRGRFVVVCASEAEARRFHRHWNQRALPAVHNSDGVASSPTENMIHASIINW
ncbi:hypothetical protein PLIIFM63780_000204 [Purpureocillium lilacinum]|nr:hypothetical protein PLIIFM63780_000204 [Purpureocillium lilacinum]